jgi:hypothetical protein
MAPLTNPISAILNLVCLRQLDSTTTLVKQVNLSQNALKQGRELLDMSWKLFAKFLNW